MLGTGGAYFKLAIACFDLVVGTVKLGNTYVELTGACLELAVTHFDLAIDDFELAGFYVELEADGVDLAGPTLNS